MLYRPIKDISNLVRGITYKKDQASKEPLEGSISILRANNIVEGRIDFSDLVFVPAALVSDEQHLVAGDIVITMSSGSKNHVGKVALYKTSMEMAFGAFCAKLSPIDVLPEYLFYILRSNSFRKHIEQLSKGTNINNIKADHILDYMIPVPPLDEQERIVGRIEELFSQLDSGVETLRKTKQQLEVYRQAVLKEAFDSVGGYDCAIEDVCKEIKVGIVIKPTQYYVESGGVRAFRNANVRRGYIDDCDWVMISQDGHQQNKKSEVHEGDVLISRSGANLGMASPVSHKYDGYNAIDIVIAVPKTDVILPAFLAHYTNSPAGRSIVKTNERGVAQGHLNVSVYGRLPITIPSLEDQHALVSRIEDKLSVCDSIEQTVDMALQQTTAMRQSILKQAFEGAL